MILNQPHYPRHLDAALERELAVRFHLPARARITPGPDFSETSDHDGFLEVDHALEIVVEWFDLRLPVGNLREVVLQVRAGLDLDFLV